MSQVTHSKIGASSMHRWSKCPGSVRLSEGVEKTSSVYAEEGTKAHELAAELVLNGSMVTEGESFPAEMVDAIVDYAEVILQDKILANSEPLVEHRFDLSSIHPGLFGTADAVLFDKEQKLLRVYDFKYGAGYAVEVESNEQLQYYGLGALLSTNFPCREVELVIVQPRCPHPDGVVRRWRFPSVQLIDFAADLKAFAKRTEEPNAPLVPGSHCKFCPAAGFCETRRSSLLVAAKEQFSAATRHDIDRLKEVLDILPQMEDWIKNVREFAYQEAMKGRTPPGYKLVAKRATRKWINKGMAQQFLEKNFGLKELDIFDFTIKSPAQIEKILKKEEKEKLKEIIVAESSGYKLARADEDGDPVRLDAKTEFTKITD